MERQVNSGGLTDLAEYSRTHLVQGSESVSSLDLLISDMASGSMLMPDLDLLDKVSDALVLKGLAVCNTILNAEETEIETPELKLKAVGQVSNLAKHIEAKRARKAAERKVEINTNLSVMEDGDAKD